MILRPLKWDDPQTLATFLTLPQHWLGNGLVPILHPILRPGRVPSCIIVSYLGNLLGEIVISHSMIGKYCAFTCTLVKNGLGRFGIYNEIPSSCVKSYEPAIWFVASWKKRIAKTQIVRSILNTILFGDNTLHDLHFVLV